jgi:hypothetical protein
MGERDLETSRLIVEAGVENLHESRMQYTGSLGRCSSVALSKRLAACYGVQHDPASELLIMVPVRRL